MHARATPQAGRDHLHRCTKPARFNIVPQQPSLLRYAIASLAVAAMDLLASGAHRDERNIQLDLNIQLSGSARRLAGRRRSSR